MNFAIMTFSLLSFALEAVLSDTVSVLPTKEEQSNLLRNVEDVFTTIQSIVSDEVDAMDEAVVEDVQKMVERSVYHLSLVEELALTKISCKTSENALCKKNSTKRIRKVIQEGEQHLHQCIEETVNNIQNNSQVVSGTMREATGEGQVLLDTLNQCSKKMGLQQITCYKKIMARDVFPLKIILVNALNIHKSGHLEAIAIRKRANECIDDVLNDYRIKVSQALSEVLTTCA